MFRNILLGGIVVYLLAVSVLYPRQRDLMFAPATERVLPHDVGLGEVAEVALTTSEGLPLYSWYGRAKSGQPTLLYFHGNGGSVSTRVDKIQQLMSKG